MFTKIQKEAIEEDLERELSEILEKYGLGNRYIRCYFETNIEFDGRVGFTIKGRIYNTNKGEFK